jgi:hypothetical protein
VQRYYPCFGLTAPLVSRCTYFICHRYRKLEILDLNWRNSETFVDFVQSHIRSYHAKGKSTKLSYRSSNVKELFNLLYHTPEPERRLELVTVASEFAIWSLTFGIAQVDAKDDFVRTFKFLQGEQQAQRQPLSCLKCAESIVEVMRLMFPLPVALFSYLIEKRDSNMKEVIEYPKLLKLIKPFYVWSMHPGTSDEAVVEENTFHIRVHVANDDIEKSDRKIMCVFKGLSGIGLLELQNSISSCLHKEFGIVSIAFATISRDVEEQGSKLALVEKLPTKVTRLFNAISKSCTQSTKVLLDFRNTSTEIMPEVFILEQTLDVFGMYRELVAAFFMDLKEELQQRIHGEDKDGVCKAAYERISRSPAVCLPLYFFELGRNAQRRIVGSVPDDFLLCKPVNDNSNAHTNCCASDWSLFCLSSWKNNEDINAVNRYEHDFDFPFLTSDSMASMQYLNDNQRKKILEDGISKDSIKALGNQQNKLLADVEENWKTYFEYLYLNCNDDRPYAPCWDPIALQKKADEIRHRFELKIRTGGNEASESIESLVTHSYSRFRKLVMDEVQTVMGRIQEKQRYSSRDVVVMMNRLQVAIKKVFYFVFCCKRIVLCQKCCRTFGLKPAVDRVDTSDLKPAVDRVDTSDAFKCSNYAVCGVSRAQDKNVQLFSDFRRFGLQSVDPENSDDQNQKRLRKQRTDLKRFCFRWLIEVAFNLKKACSTSFLRHSLAINSLEIVVNSGKNDELKVKAINLSSRAKKGVEPVTTAKERSRLLGLFSETVELCKSGRLMLLNEVSANTNTSDQIVHAIVMSEEVNRVIAECDELKTGCSVYEKFPNIGNTFSVNVEVSKKSVATATGKPEQQKSRRRSVCVLLKPNEEPGKKLMGHMTHLIVAAIENNADKAYQYMIRADLEYIFHDYIDTNELDPRKCDRSFEVASCALHMALERGHTDVAIKIIDRVYSLAREEVFEYYTKTARDIFLERLFIGAFRVMEPGSDALRTHLEIPTSFMYLARYSMTNEMDKLIEILKRLKKLDDYQGDLCKYIIEPTDANGLNALHYAVLSQSPSSVSWFVPLMHVFRVCQSSSKFTFVPQLVENQNLFAMGAVDEHPFWTGYSQFLRMHRPKDFSDSDRRLSVSEDWIQTYHSTDINMSLDGGLKQHREISPYELALLVWRLLDVESTLFQEMLFNLATNAITKDDEPFSARPQSQSQSAAGRSLEKEDKMVSPFCCFGKIHPSEDKSSSPDTRDKVGDQVDDEDDTHERLAASYKVRSSKLYTILNDLEDAANQEVDIDSKKKKGLKELLNYRSHRAVSRMVFPGLSYLLYVFFATLMAILMTNGLFDEPTKFTHAVVNELGWEKPQRAINAISSFSDLTTWWGVLAGFLWESSPMAKPFGEKIATWTMSTFVCTDPIYLATYNLLGPVLVRQTRTDRSSCNNGQARCTPSNYRSIT